MNVGEALHRSPGVRELAPLIGAWIGFALFSIIGAVFVGLRADRMAIGGVSPRWALSSMCSTCRFPSMLPSIPAGY